ncbi:MAG: GNAT family N-acetyltransferase [Leptolyngbyaceae cyanobacterium SM1_1_3]|nr:GNAT family N-acetyltransferase [Leptolyngbyaceae cyanobacterium SM1_1_3]NJN04828.1 GNAT family N-acetyltransferase [Leptolyngbyaceae cyanobacterium RM1_1_2]
MIKDSPRLLSSRICLRMGEPEDVPAIVQYYTVNQAYLQPYEPLRNSSFYSQWYWRSEVDARKEQFWADRSLRMFLFERDRLEVLGVVNFNRIVRGLFQSSTLGYNLAENKQGQGYMSEALNVALPYAFEQLDLRRIVAAYMPRNVRSANLLKRLGFKIDGRVRNYLQINGRWEDHVLTSLSRF